MNTILSRLNRVVAAFSEDKEDPLRAELLELYEPFLEYNVDNLLANVLEWDKLAALIDGQAVNGFNKRVAAGLLKVLLKTKTNYSYKVAGKKTKEFNPQV